MTSTRPVIAWFRQDLRLADNPALTAAAECGAPVIPVFVHEEASAGDWAPGPASRWWLDRSLQRLAASLDDALLVCEGDPQEVIPRLALDSDAALVTWNRCVEPWRAGRDEAIKEHLQGLDVAVRSFNGNYLYDPATVTKSDGTPYRMFTPFYRKGCLENAPAPRTPLPPPAGLDTRPAGDRRGTAATTDDDRYRRHDGDWQPGEQGAQDALAAFLAGGLDGYASNRDRPDLDAASRLSPHLHFGEISPQQVRDAVLAHCGERSSADAEKFLAELGWRDFSAHLLLHQPGLPADNLQKLFDRFPWERNDGHREAWAAGETGYPIVDAGMRELLASGYMHNRVRMIVASFLVKNLLQDWRYGARWFWDHLLDADLANNSASWQWVAGSGADAAPFFRIFNPVTQGRKFDPEGEYVRRHVPQLAGLPARFVHSPWEAPAEVLAAAGLRPGEDYPQPIVELRASRERALNAYKSLRGAS